MRPTSETIINTYFSKWIQSYRDLPLLVEPVGQHRSVGAAPPPVPAHHRVPLAGRPHGHATYEDATRLRGRRSSSRSTRTSWSTCSRSRSSSGARRRGNASRRDQHARVRGHDGRRQGAADGHQPRARSELRQGVRHAVHRARRVPWSTCGRRSWGSSTRMVGGLIMAHGDDDGLRVPPDAGPHPSGRAPRARRATGLVRRPPGSPTSCAPPACGPSSTPRIDVASVAGRPTGSSRAFRCASRWALATWPTVTSPSSGATAATKAPVPLGEVGRAGAGACSAEIQQGLLADATAPARRHDRRRGHARRGGRGGRQRVRPRPWAVLSATARARTELRQQAVTVRCLPPSGRDGPGQRGRARPRRHVARAY